MSPRQKEPLTYEHALLGFITPAPMHAYAVHVALMRSPLGAVWHIKQSACYAMISRLADEALINASAENMASRGKRMMTITPYGLTCFQVWCETPVPHPRDMRIEFLAKLYFATVQSMRARQQLIAAQQAKLATWYAVRTPVTGFAAEVEAYRRGQIDAIAYWLAQLS